jgi:hypothetical protein
MIANIANRATCIFLSLAGDRKSPDFYHIKAGPSNYMSLSYIGCVVYFSGQGKGIYAASVSIQYLSLNATIYIT